MILQKFRENKHTPGDIYLDSMLCIYDKVLIQNNVCDESIVGSLRVEEEQ